MMLQQFKADDISSVLTGDEVAVFHKKPHFKQGKFYPESMLAIYHDEDGVNPREEYDNVGKMICHHRNYVLGDKHSIDFRQFESGEDLRDYLIEEYNAEIILPLYLYDHSGISISVGNPADTCDPGGWDTSFVGFVYCTKEDIEKEWRGAYDKAEGYLRGEVENYNDYLTGNCYGYIEFKPNNETGEWERGDSCWGFLGDYKYILEETGYSEKEAIEGKRRW
jgi:hypothetical protein